MKNFPLIIILSLLFSMILGCGIRSPKTEFYILNIQKQSTNIDVNFENKIHFDEVIIPSYLDRTSIVLRNSNNVQLDIAEYYNWAESLDLGIERILKDVLSYELAKHHIMLEQIYNDRNMPQLSFNILRFDSTMGGNSVIEAHWILSNDNNEIITQGFYYDKIPAGNTFDSIVKAQSQLIALFAKSKVIPLSKEF